MLPGQLVNVLNVPFALSSSRSRNDSVSSTSSEVRTMDPTDKFMNPRPVPAKPSLPRLKTSPTLPQHSWPLTSSPASAGSGRGRSASSQGLSGPGGSSTSKGMRITKKPSFLRHDRSTSRESSRSTGIIGAFRALASPRTASPETAMDRGRAATVEHELADGVRWAAPTRSTTPKSSDKGQTLRTFDVATGSPSVTPRRLAFRKDFDDDIEDAVVALSSFGQHRRQRSMSREPSSLRNSLSLDDSPVHQPFDGSETPYQRLETLKEVASATNTPVWPLTALKIETSRPLDEGLMPLDLQKRLPTLPNTPSSVYPPSILDGSPTDCLAADIEALKSRFSSTTIETGSCTDSYINNEEVSRFSDWTYSTRLSPRSEGALSNTIGSDLTSPQEKAHLDFDAFRAISVPLGAELEGRLENPGALQEMPSALSFSTVSSEASSTTPSSHEDLDSARDADLCWSKFQHYSLPAEDVGSGLTLKATSSDRLVAPLAVDERQRTEAFPTQVAELDSSALLHSTTMQQLLDELSYLSGMIQQN